jgi:hypothetical protein
MKDALLIELAEMWELQAATGGDGLNALKPPARETLRACADMLRMLVDAAPLATPPSPPLPPPQGGQEAIQWPSKKTVGRCGDMGPAGDHQLTVLLQDDGDVVVQVVGTGFGSRVASASVEFCAPGAGGGRSARTRMALIGLMCAIEADNEQSPAVAWPPLNEGEVT